jgi:hypothetical protein
MSASSFTRQLRYHYNDADYSNINLSRLQSPPEDTFTDGGEINLELDPQVCRCSFGDDHNNDTALLPPCQRVLLMGLGGGKLLGYLLRHHPCIAVDTVEKYIHSYF